MRDQQASYRLHEKSDSTHLNAAAVTRFCEPVSAITAPVEPARFDVLSQALQLLRESSAARTETNLRQTSTVVEAALAVAYDLESRGESRAAARELMAFLEARLQATLLSEPNRLLADADVTRMSSRSLTGLIRSTFLARRRLPAWNGAYARAWKRAQELGRSPESLFVGLPSPEKSNDAAKAG